MTRKIPRIEAESGRMRATGVGAPAVLVAGVGNVFFRDDAFGVEVARCLSSEPLPGNVRVADFGIRGVHLAYELLEPLGLLILVDAMTRDGSPGTLYLLDPEQDSHPRAPCDPHALDPWAVFALVEQLGGRMPRTRVVGCEPQDLSEGMSLSEPVQDAIQPAISMIRRLIESEVLQ